MSILKEIATSEEQNRDHSTGRAAEQRKAIRRGSNNEAQTIQITLY
jgi:hypothetical protein